MQTHIETIKGTVEHQHHYHIWCVSQRNESELCPECGQVYPGKHKGPKIATRMDEIYKQPQSANVARRRKMARNEDPDITDYFVRQCAEDCEDSE